MTKRELILALSAIDSDAVVLVEIDQPREPATITGVVRERRYGVEVVVIVGET